MNWEIGIDMYTLICIKWITNKNLLYKKINKKKFKKKKKKNQGKNLIPEFIIQGTKKHQNQKVTVTKDTKKPR